MSMETSVLHAYLDGALASQEHEEIQQAIQRDEALRQQRDEVEAQRDFVEDRLALLTQEDIPLPSTQRQLTRLYDALAAEERTPTKPTASTTQTFQIHDLPHRSCKIQSEKMKGPCAMKGP